MFHNVRLHSPIPAKKVAVDPVVLDREKLEPIIVSEILFFGSRKRMNLLLTIACGVVGLVVSFLFFIPPELAMFRLIAAIGMMVGYQVGRLARGLVRGPPKRFLILSVGAVLCFYSAFAYASLVQMDTSDIANLGALFGLFFLWLGFLLPFARVLVPNEIENLWSKAIGYCARLFRG